MKKSFKKLIATVLCLVMCMTLLTGCSTSKSVPLTLTIDGHTFDFSSTIQDLYDAGFVICDTSYGKILYESSLPVIGAREVHSTFYYIGRDTGSTRAEFTGVYIQVYNPHNSDCDFKDASIYNYTYCYDPTAETSIPVLFNGVSFAGLTPDEGVAAMESLGITFEEDEKEEFINPETNSGYGWSILTSSSSYRYFLSREVDMELNLYIDEIYFEKKLDVEYK